MKEFFGRLMAFLNRDVCSFFRQSPGIEQPPKPPDLLQTQTKPEPEPEPEPEPAPTLPLPLLLNPAALDRVAFRREILDWRDNSIMQLDVAANIILKKFSNHVITLLEDEPIWRRPLPRKTDDVLVADFHNEVTLPIRAKTQEFDHHLDEIMSRWGDGQASRLRLSKKSPIKREGEITDCGFKPSNQQYILDAISLLVLGPDGSFDRFYQRISRITIRIIDEV